MIPRRTDVLSYTIQERSCGSLLVIMLLTQKLISILEVLVQSRQGNPQAGRFQRALTRLIQRRTFSRHSRLIEAVKVREAPSKRLP